ncbi:MULTISPECIES: nuclear transport factor 2 family protein [Aquimarina]|uniref:nuclear transport factor 2 family protein n=1 Tax=Aquimarina TaxID=290174 RepID=UPI000D693139|nr:MULTISPECIES: nuclear transport factor 2 family protein [Aquimarina]
MKKIHLIYISFFTLILTVLLSCSSNTNKPSVNDEQKLWETIAEFNQAFKNSNVEKLKAMITDNYIHTNGSSESINKNTWVNYLHKRNKDIENGDLIVNAYEMSEETVQFYDNVAIVTAKILVSNTRQGNLQENGFRVTNIWVRENGNWKRAGFHDGKIK